MKTRVYYQKVTSLPTELTGKGSMNIQNKTYLRDDKLCPVPNRQNDPKKEQDRVRDIPWFDF